MLVLLSDESFKFNVLAFKLYVLAYTHIVKMLPSSLKLLHGEQGRALKIQMASIHCLNAKCRDSRDASATRMQTLLTDRTFSRFCSGFSHYDPAFILLFDVAFIDSQPGKADWMASAIVHKSSRP